MKSILVVACWLSTLYVAFGQQAIQHEIGVDLGLGISGVLYPNRAQFSPAQARVTGWSPDQSTSVALKYQALLFDGRFNLGAGIGYQRKRYLEDRVWNIPGVLVGQIRSPFTSETVMIPLEVGYRLPLGGRHSLTADALVIPTYQLGGSTSDADWNGTAQLILPVIDRISLDLGLKLGYRLQLSEQWSLQAAIIGTWEPFEHPAFLQETYNLQLVLGARRHF